MLRICCALPALSHLPLAASSRLVSISPSLVGRTYLPLTRRQIHIRTVANRSNQLSLSRPMRRQISLSFLGTCCGGGPLLERACSSSLLNIDGALWLIDCAEGTQIQIQRAHLRTARLNRIFITHMHGDHTLGVVPLLTNIMSGAGGTSSDRLRIELYGPSGLRKLIRLTLTLIEARLNGRYKVHELLRPSDTAYSCAPEDLHGNELAGRDIWCDSDGLWRDFEKAEGLSLHAGPIAHRASCMGYVFEEPVQPDHLSTTEHIEPLERNREALLNERGIRNPNSLLRELQQDRKPIILPDGYELVPPPLSIPGRKIVVLGDTSDPQGITPIAMDASILVHEATNAYIPPLTNDVNGISKKDGESQESVRARAISRGHATPVMAGEFARLVRARRLVMNHFSTRYLPAKSTSRRNSYQNGVKDPNPERVRVLKEIENQATQAWKGDDGIQNGATAITAWDFLSINIPNHEVGENPDEELRDLRAHT